MKTYDVSVSSYNDEYGDEYHLRVHKFDGVDVYNGSLKYVTNTTEGKITFEYWESGPDMDKLIKRLMEVLDSRVMVD